MRGILLGILAALFFSVTFVLNRSMELGGGSWLWSASLRFIFMLPILFIIVLSNKNLKPLFLHMKKQPFSWVIWSTVGFGLFYAPLTFATVYGPGWLVAATFQITIIAGSLLVPFLNSKSAKQTIPIQSVFISLIILIGIFAMQIEHATSVTFLSVILIVIPTLISAFAYPLGNRKMMQLVGNDLNTFQRLLGMTIASMPFWLILSIFGLISHGLPSISQVSQSFIVAVSAGIIATALFFYATELVKDDNEKLAGVEATQSAEVLFAVFGEVLFLSTPMPNLLSIIGIFLVFIGMVLHSVISTLHRRKTLGLLNKKQSS